MAEFLGGRKWAGRNFKIMGVGGDDGSKGEKINAAQAKECSVTPTLICTQNVPQSTQPLTEKCALPVTPPSCRLFLMDRWRVQCRNRFTTQLPSSQAFHYPSLLAEA